MVQRATCHPVRRLLGKASFQLQDLQGAEAAYQQAVGLNGRRPEAYRGLSEVHRAAGLDAQLVDDFRALVRVGRARTHSQMLASWCMGMRRPAAAGHARATCCSRVALSAASIL